MDDLFGPMSSLFDLNGDGKLDAGECTYGFMVMDDMLSEEDGSDEGVFFDNDDDEPEND